MKEFRIICLLMFSISSCSSQPRGSFQPHIEVVVIKKTFFPEGDQQFSSPLMELKQKVWYKDSIAIEEVMSLSIHQSGNNTPTVTNTFLYYRYNNLRTRTSYQYLSFTDTASIDTKFLWDDTTGLVGGWNFPFERKYPHRVPPKILADTIINNLEYKRIQLQMGTEQYPQVMTYFCRCDKIGTVFNHNPSISALVGCPITFKQDYSLLKNDLALSSEIVFLSDTLTEKEKKIFEAWQRNEVENPVKRKSVK